MSFVLPRRVSATLDVLRQSPPSPPQTKRKKRKKKLQLRPSKPVVPYKLYATFRQKEISPLRQKKMEDAIRHWLSPCTPCSNCSFPTGERITEASSLAMSTDAPLPQIPDSATPSRFRIRRFDAIDTFRLGWVQGINNEVPSTYE